MDGFRVLDPSFFAPERNTREIARALLGQILVHGTTAGRIVETEAYLGVSDRACHAWGGKRSPRLDPLYGPPGHAYIYLIYGMYHCLNVVTKPEGQPECVLIRALEPLAGLETMAARSGRAKAALFCSGPGRLCRALGLDRSLSGSSLLSGDFFLAEGSGIPAELIGSSPRIGVDYAGEDKDRPWRYYVKGSPFVSRIMGNKVKPADS
ncbi:MAG: DNA-3-methyladenine glycosylase [Oscillospiraceae bacterium]|nr:DNA-3-methyladenine glycosylase [Oscillospiraceae bacterium]